MKKRDDQNSTSSQSCRLQFYLATPGAWPSACRWKETGCGRAGTNGLYCSSGRASARRSVHARSRQLRSADRHGTGRMPRASLVSAMTSGWPCQRWWSAGQYPQGSATACSLCGRRQMVGPGSGAQVSSRGSDRRRAHSRPCQMSESLPVGNWRADGRGRHQTASGAHSWSWGTARRSHLSLTRRSRQIYIIIYF